MHQITIHFRPASLLLDSGHFSGRALHSLLFKVLRQADPDETDWLHNHGSPKPFSLAPLYTEGGLLAGLRVGTVSPRVAQLVVRGWRWHREQGHVLNIDSQALQLDDITCVAGPEWPDLVETQPVTGVEIEFLSPTAFRQGLGHLLLPVPYSVFSGPWNAWQAYAPLDRPPDDWLNWCRQNVFVADYHLKTAYIRVNVRSGVKGLVGWARFQVQNGKQERLRMLHALAQLAVYTGVGLKTTVGMGAVDLTRVSVSD